MLHLPRVMLAAPSSGSGKTMITCGILQAMKDRGMDPASFKCGPDYIDPMFHSRIIGARSRNLDTFFTGREVTRHLFARTAARAGISILEGVMGLYDGLGGLSSLASSYDLAAVTDTPVILVINGKGMSLSLVPLIQGFVQYQKRFGKEVIRGVILNRTTKMTYALLKDELERQTGLRLYGWVPEQKDCVVESRHLGLVTPDEISDLRQRMHRFGQALEQHLDLDGITALAHGAADYEDTALCIPRSVRPLLESEKKDGRGEAPEEKKVRIGVAMDEAFCFYYQDNLDLLSGLGAELTFFSPLHDRHLPGELDGLILGGGYPELYAGALSENETMRREIREAIEKGLPYLAECGGFMYLQESMEDMEGISYPMCGCISGHSYRTPKLSRFGYITLQTASGHREQLLLAGQAIRGHEFHYFDSTSPGEDYIARKPKRQRQWNCIHGNGQSAAGYPHLYYWSNPAFAAEYLAAARRYRRGKGSNTH